MSQAVAVDEGLSLDEAVARIRRRPVVGDVERVPVGDALHRVLAADVVSPLPVPAHDSAAMDGYAFRHADLADGRVLPVRGRVAAGHPDVAELDPGTAVRIFTGGMLPAGADTVAMQEHCTVTDRLVTVPADLVRGANVRRAGNDVRPGTTVLVEGTRMRPQDVGIAAAVGRAELLVRRRVRVGVVATGDELRAPGEPLPPGCIHDSNRHTIGAALRALGAVVVDAGVVGDRRSAVRDALVAVARSADLVVTTGGVSAGDEDHVRAALQDVGTLDFWKLPLKPGRPVAVGAVGGVPVVGLPGNPVSAMVTFWLVARPFVLHLMGAAPTEPTRFGVVAAFTHRHRRGRRELVPARLRAGASGDLLAERFRAVDSGMLSALTWSDGFVEIPEDAGDVSPGDTVSYLPYDGLG
ncbi:molybdopterin molybdotransferase MoeA [Pseudonocardia sp.]|uniref:molybdopterin molybdotransferase MoeA n=1 Tax=Pseudonocardia sp. TaxID=60912 RepID=UPI003D130666